MQNDGKYFCFIINVICLCAPVMFLIKVMHKKCLPSKKKLISLPSYVIR